MLEYSGTHVLLIGASHFPDEGLPPIPNVAINISLLTQVLADTTLVGIPVENIHVSLNESKREIEKKMRDIAIITNSNKNSLIIYYSGHGKFSNDDYTLYLTTSYTTAEYLEVDGLNIEAVKKHVQKSNAGRKVVILDCCHSGAIIGMMNDMPSAIQAQIQKIEGTYIITSAAHDAPSFFPFASPDEPTYFTGKFLEIMNEGLNIEKEHCTLRDIFNKIDTEFSKSNLPRPQQFNKNRIDELDFVKNKKYKKKGPQNQKVIEKTDERYATFLKLMEERKNRKTKKITIPEKNEFSLPLEEEDAWTVCSKFDSEASFTAYLTFSPFGKHYNEAKQRLKFLKVIAAKNAWNTAKEKNLLEGYQKYLEDYPKGDYVPLAHIRIKELITGVQMKEILNKPPSNPPTMLLNALLI